MELPGPEDDKPNELARFALEQIAWREYRAVEGKVVLVKCLSGYDENGYSCDVFFGNPVRVRVDRHANNDDICRWMDGDHLDPIWDVEIVDPGDPALAGMRSCWVHATSRSISGRIEEGDAVAVESPMARFARAIGLSKVTGATGDDATESDPGAAPGM